MGEAAQKSRAKAAIVGSEPRCIYCSSENTPDRPLTLEHMPPIGLFRDRYRLKGMEFGCCEACNVGTKGADIAGSVFALISQYDAPDDWRPAAMTRLLPALDRFAPGVRDEVMLSPRQRQWGWTPRGLVEPRIAIRAHGPLIKRYLSVFAAKIAMALYREHVGSALPLDGAVYTMHFLNAGLAQDQADSMLSIMPAFGRMEQGRNTSAGQFEYRYNCDNRSLLAALVSFHHNLHVMLIATSDHQTYGFISKLPNMQTTHPGELVRRLSP